MQQMQPWPPPRGRTTRLERRRLPPHHLGRHERDRSTRNRTVRCRRLDGRERGPRVRIRPPRATRLPTKLRSGHPDVVGVVVATTTTIHVRGWTGRRHHGQGRHERQHHQTAPHAPQRRGQPGEEAQEAFGGRGHDSVRHFAAPCRGRQARGPVSRPGASFVPRRGHGPRVRPRRTDRAARAPRTAPRTPARVRPRARARGGLRS